MSGSHIVGTEASPNWELTTVGETTVAWTVRSSEADYEALRQGAGVLDHSGSMLIEVGGVAAEDVVNATLTREVGYLTPDRTIMGLILDDDGGIVDLVTVFRTEEAFLVHTSLSRGHAVFETLSAQASGGATVTDLSEELCLLGVEGPRATDAVDQVIAETIEGLPFQGVRLTEWSGGPVRVSRTGVTGEFGYCFMVAREQVSQLWRALSKVADPVGLQAVEVTMLEIRQPIVYREVSSDDTVLSAGFNWLVDLEKDAFLGRDALLRQIEAGSSSSAITVLTESPAGAQDKVVLDNEEIGHIVHVAFSPSAGGFCGVARVKSEYAASGLPILVNGSPGRTVSPPVVAPTSWRALQV